ncbi:MAG: putative porin [Elusimicrobiales bacterium]|nr:putative porin [Elusimicrobiales bacterium]
MKKGAVFACAWLALSCATASAQQVVFNNLLNKVTFSGELLLRHESVAYDAEGKNKPDYMDERFLLRLGAAYDMGSGFSASARLASGGGSQATVMQTETTLSSQKSIWIDRAFAEYKALGDGAAGLSLFGGKMANPFESSYVSQMVWSAYFNPEGYAEKFSLKTGETTLFVNALQLAANNNAASAPANAIANQWMFGGQAGAKTSLGADRTLKADVGWFDWSGAGVTLLDAANTAANQQPGNRRDSTGRLLSRFSVAEATVQYTDKLFGLPLDVQASAIKNLTAVSDPALLGGDTTGSDDSGYMAGFILGQAKAAKTWEAAWFYKMVEADATISDITDTTFGPGGTNHKGHVFWAAYSPTANTQFKLRYYITQPVAADVSTYTGSATTKTAFVNTNRLTLDATFTF